MRQEHRHVDLVVDGGGDAIGGLDLVAEVDHRDAIRCDEAGGFGGDRADEADRDAVDLPDRVLAQRRVARTRVVDVRAEREVGTVAVGFPELLVERLDAVGDVGVALIELVVADRAHVESSDGERLHRRLVLLDEGREGRGADVVSG